MNEKIVDVKVLNGFFKGLEKNSMPEAVKKLVTSGTTFKFGDLETITMSSDIVRMHALEVYQKIKMPAGYESMNIEIAVPVVVNSKTPEHHFYEPTTGDYIGKADIQPF